VNQPYLTSWRRHVGTATKHGRICPCGSSNGTTAFTRSRFKPTPGNLDIGSLRSSGEPLPQLSGRASAVGYIPETRDTGVDPFPPSPTQPSFLRLSPDSSHFMVRVSRFGMISRLRFHLDQAEAQWQRREDCAHLMQAMSGL